ncbi:hypothetical protein VP01_8087g1, partial [Puccinia sorghi]
HHLIRLSNLTATGICTCPISFPIRQQATKKQLIDAYRYNKLLSQTCEFSTMSKDLLNPSINIHHILQAKKDIYQERLKIEEQRKGKIGETINELEASEAIIFSKRNDNQQVKLFHLSYFPEDPGICA